MASDTVESQPLRRKIKSRSLDELMMPDTRSASFVRLDPETGQVAQINIEDTEQMLVEIEAALTSAAPAEIRRRVGVARDLIVYAWFCYDFLAVSMFWCCSCIEMALAAKFAEMNPGPRQITKRRDFQSLLDWASKKKLLPDEASPDAVRKLRNSMAHPKDFNTIVPPAMAITVFELLLRIVARLWPIAVASEPTEKQLP